MLKSRTNSSQMVFDALSISADIVTLGGSTRQMFYTTERTYEDDRKWVPCILGGKVYVNDPSNIMTGFVALSDIEWYTQMPIEGDYSTGRISNPVQSILDDVDVYDEDTGELIHEAAWRSQDYLISDGSNNDWCSNVPNLCLIVHKNIPQLTAITLYAVLKFVDQRTGLTIRVLRNIDFSTEQYDTEMVFLKGDGGDEILIDPLSITDAIPAGNTILDIPWTRTVRTQLKGTNGDIPDNEACYLWCIEDGSTLVGWRPFTEDEIESMQITGANTKVLTLDARMINTKIRLRCYGCRRESGEAWKSPLDENNPFYTIQFTVTLNDTLHANPIQLTGAKQDVTMSIPCSYEIQIRYNSKEVPENRRCLFRAHWKAQNINTGAIVSLGTSPNMTFIPKDLGFVFPDGFVVWADVSTYAGCRIVIENNKKVMSGNMQVISPTFE